MSHDNNIEENSTQNNLVIENAALDDLKKQPTNEDQERSIQEENKDIEFDDKKWLYAFYGKLNGENKKFYILKPNRKLRQNGELEYARQLAKFVREGLLPKAAWGTILDNSGGTISESEAKNYSTLRTEYFELALELSKLQQKESNEENQKKIEDVIFKIDSAKNKIQSFELEQVYIFENTAEAKARNSTIEWWLCNISYDQDGKLFFQGETQDDKLDWYDALDTQKDEELLKIGHKFSYLITLWYLNRINTKEDFKNIDV
jgi:hypothetical protein